VSLKGIYFAGDVLPRNLLSEPWTVLDGSSAVTRPPRFSAVSGSGIFVPPPGHGARVLCDVPHGRALRPLEF